MANTVDVEVCESVTKTYTFEVIETFGTRYTGDMSWIAYWFYTQYDSLTDGVHITVHGDWHQTYPNPYHLSVKITTPSGAYTPMLHISQDEYGYGYMQDLYQGQGISKRKQSKRKQSKRKQSKRKQSKRKINT
jgi:hypothetical protein